MRLPDKDLLTIYDRLDVLGYKHDVAKMPLDLALNVLAGANVYYDIQKVNPLLAKYAAIRIASELSIRDAQQLALELAAMAHREYSKYGSQAVADRLLAFSGKYDRPNLQPYGGTDQE